jgi:uncharacterized protein (TIGR00288 family)
MDEPSVALYWDFENIHASLYNDAYGPNSYSKSDNRFSVQEPLVDVQKVFDFAASFGNIVINKAYCNWQWLGRYRDVLLKNAIELIQLFPPGASAKNGSDIKMALDAVEDIIRFRHINYIVIVGGDSDYIPLAQKAKAAGKTIIGIGCQSSTNRYWANSCNDFKYYESIETVEQDKFSDEITPERMIKQAIQQLSSKNGNRWVLKAAIRPLVKRLHPTFDEGAYNATTFSELLSRYDAIFETRKGEYDHEVAIRRN